MFLPSHGLRAMPSSRPLAFLLLVATLAGGGKSSVVMLPMDVVESVKNIAR